MPAIFLEQFLKFLKGVIIYPGNMAILGDLDLHMDFSSDANAIIFFEFLNYF